MAQAAGYAILPITTSLLGVNEELRKQLVGPIQRASKQAGDAIRKSMTDGVDQAAKNTEKAQYRVRKSTEELETAESKLREQREKARAASLALEDAARKRAEAEGKGIDAISKAEQDLAKKRAAAEREARNLAAAEGGVEKAMTESAKAAKSLADRQSELEDATEGAEKKSRGFISSLRDMGDELDETGKKSAGFGDKLMSGLGKVGTGALLGVGAKIGTTVMGGIGTAFSKGFGRLESLQMAEASLAGLGRSAEDVEKIMNSVNQSVTGTAFGLDEAAKSAATFSTLGVKSGEDMDRVMGLLVDTTAQANSTLDEMSPIMNKIVAAGGLNIETYDQLNERATGVGEALSKHLGIPMEEVREKANEIDFETFAAAMEKNIGGSAQKSGETFGNAFGNMNAALGRLGQKFLEPAFNMGPAVFGAIGGAVDKLGEQLEPVISDWSERLTPVMEDFAEKLGPWLEETIDNVAIGLKETVGWIRENADWLKALGVGIGTITGIYTAWTIATKVHTAATMLAAKAVLAFDKITKRTIWGAIAAAITAVVSGLVYFFTQTETGKKAWESFTSTMVAGWEWVSEKVGGGIDWIQGKWSDFTGWISTAWSGITSLFKGDFTSDLRETFGIEEDHPIIVGFFFLRDTAIKVGEVIGKVWEGIVTAGKVAFAILGTVVLTPIMITWNALSDAFKWGWETLIKPVFEAFAAMGTWLWETVLSPAFSAIADGWQWVSDRFSVVWEIIKIGVFEAWNWYIDRVRANWELVTGALNTAWTLVKDTFIPIWETIRTVVFDAWNAYADRVKANWDIVTAALNTAWEGVKIVFGVVWDWIRDNVFSKFNTAIDLMKSGAEIAMDGIGKAFDWLREKTARPVNFVIREVYMGGIRPAWEAVSGLVGLDGLPEVEEIGGYAQGTARVPGPRTPYDNVHMVSQDGQFGISLRGGEGVLVPEAVDGLGEGAINALNHAGLHGGKRAVDRVLNALNLGGFDRGGFIDLGGFNFGGVTNLAGNLSGIQRSHAQFVGRFFPGLFNLTSAGRNEPGSYHDFSTMGATDWQAKDGQFASQMPTAGSKALARAIFKNFSNSAELIHHPLDGWQNILNGGPHNYGPGTNAAHRNHVHWATRSPLQFDGDNIVLEDSGGGFFETITNMAKRLWDAVIDKVPSMPGADTFGKMGQLPAAWLKKVASSAWDHIKGLADKLMPFGGGGGDAEQWRPLASQALKRMGYDDRYLDAMVQQIQIESTGDPNAVNRWDSNWLRGTPSKGLLQVIDPTYQDVRRRYPEAFEGLPDDPTHPLTNLVAGVGAVKRDWGGPGGRWPTKDGYHKGGLAGWGQGWMRKTALEPEMVLNPAMTEAFIKWMDVAQDVAQAIAPTAGASARGYVEEQATGMLDVFGLGGLVDIGSTLVDRHGPQVHQTAMSLFGATQNPDTTAEVSFGGRKLVLEFNAESLDDVVRIGDLKEQADRIDGLEVKLNEKKKPPAATVTRGGVM